MAINIEKFMATAKKFEIEEAFVSIGPNMLYLMLLNSSTENTYIPLDPASARDLGDALLLAADKLLNPETNPY